MPGLVFLCWWPAGISGKTQVLFAMVFVTRYLDLFTTFISVYNSVMKTVYILGTFFTIYLIYMKFKATYDSNHDTFRMEFLVVPVAGLACLVNHEFTVMEVRKCFRISLLAKHGNHYYCYCTSTHTSPASGCNLSSRS